MHPCFSVAARKRWRDASVQCPAKNTCAKLKVETEAKAKAETEAKGTVNAEKEVKAKIAAEQKRVRDFSKACDEAEARERAKEAQQTNTMVKDFIAQPKAEAKAETKAKAQTVKGFIAQREAEAEAKAEAQGTV